jgi:hypothetical protein
MASCLHHNNLKRGITMANHSFNITLAEKYGVEQAILIEHIYWWVHKNECDGIEDMVKDGKVWCRSTAKGFAKYIPYLKPDKIWRILRKMEGHILLVGNFNKQALNQTLWYTFTDEFKKELEDLNYDFENFKNANLKNKKSNNSIINNPINKEDKIKEDKEKVLSCDNTKSTLTEEEILYDKAMKKQYPHIMRMEQPLTLEQAKKLKGKFNNDLLQKIMDEMENWKPLLKKCVSAYMTINNWCNRELERS